jgi:hypothetical protein
MAQTILEYNATIAKRHRKNFYLLSGMVRCGCGRSMHAQASDNRHYYRCSEHSAGHSGITHRKCYEPMFDGARLEIVWNYIYNLLSGDFEADLAAAQEAEQQRHAPILSEIEVVKTMLAEVEQEAESVARALSGSGGIVAVKLQQEMEKINKRHSDLSAKLVKMQDELDHAPSLTNTFDICAFYEIANTSATAMQIEICFRRLHFGTAALSRNGLTGSGSGVGSKWNFKGKGASRARQ